MSSVNYSLKHKGVRLISPDEAWTKGKIRRLLNIWNEPSINPNVNI